MQSMQNLITQEIEDRIVNAGLKPVQAVDWGNTGRIYAYTGSLSTELEIGYSFQVEYCTIALKGPGINELDLDDNPPMWRMDRCPGGDEPSDHIITFHALHYSDDARLNYMLDMVADACKVSD